MRFGSSVALKKFLLKAAGKPQLAVLEKASRDVRGSSEAMLRRIIRNSRESAFGRDHGFSGIRTLADYRRNVAVAGYEAFRPYVDRMRTGEADVLFSGKPLLYNVTSGTTDKPKLIPVSPLEFKDVHTSLSRLWLYTTIRDNPAIWKGLNLSIVGAAEEGRVQDGTPYGSLSGLAYKNIPGVLKSLYSVPYPVMCIEDYLRKYYAVLRFALAENITYLIAGNPSSLIQIHRVIMDQFESLVRDIRDGTIKPDAITELDRAAKEEIRAALTPDPGRARSLEELMTRHGAQLRPKHYWPDLACVNTWKQGNCRLFIPRLDGYFPEACVIREFGYWASEARAVVLANDWDQSVLPCHLYHFEFIPETERDVSSPSALEAHEVEPGKRYYLLFSTLSGLYRYDINDVVEVTGFHNQFPMIKFLYKGQGVTSLTGEKLSEEQTILAVNAAAGDTGHIAEFFTLICNEAECAYTLYVEFSPPHLGQLAIRAFSKAFDDYLKEVNIEYNSKRLTGRLAAPGLKLLPAGSYELLKQKLNERRTIREGQYKVSYLRRDLMFVEIFKAMSVQAVF
jgi:hypothetical protein